MRMAELSRRSDVRVATIKYYLREGLLPPGSPTAMTRAEYSEAHLRRLRLIRALVEIGEVPVSAIKKILTVVDDESQGVHRMLGAVQYQLGPHPAPPPQDDPGWRQADELISEMGWTINPVAPPARCSPRPFRRWNATVPPRQAWAFAPTPAPSQSWPLSRSQA